MAMSCCSLNARCRNVRIIAAFGLRSSRTRRVIDEPLDSFEVPRVRRRPQVHRVEANSSGNARERRMIKDCASTGLARKRGSLWAWDPPKANCGRPATEAGIHRPVRVQ